MTDQTFSSGFDSSFPTQGQPQSSQPQAGQSSQSAGKSQGQNPQQNQQSQQQPVNQNPQVNQAPQQVNPTPVQGQPPADQSYNPPTPPTPPTPPVTQNQPTPPAPPAEEDTTPANFHIAKHLPAVINVAIPAHTLQFDEQHFLHLLAGSISLTKDEKKRIVESIPKLRQSQIDELVRIFEEERRKFAELSAKHVPQLEKLVKQHWAEWQDIELEQKASEKKNEDQAQADEIRKQLGL